MKEKLLITGDSNFLIPHLIEKTVIVTGIQTGINKIIFPEKYLSKINNLPLTRLRPAAFYWPRKKMFLVIKMISKNTKAYGGSNKQNQSFSNVKDLAVLVNRCLRSAINGEFRKTATGNCATCV